MAVKGKIYKTEGTIDNPELLDQLKATIIELEEKMKASIKIFKGLSQAGFGASKVQRGIAADSVISIAKAIKALKGW